MSSAALGRPVSESRHDALTTYLHEIGAYPLLDTDAEARLSDRIRAGDADALQELVCANLRFVVSVAKKYQHHGVSLADLINEGNIGLMRAARRFDAVKGVRFVSYAIWWIRQAIVRAIADQGHTVRVPVTRAGAVYRMGRRANTLRMELGREPTQAELGAGLGMSAEELAITAPLSRSYLSLDAPLGTDDSAGLLEYLPDDTVSTPDREVAENALSVSLEDALGALRAREAKILRQYFGFDGAEPMTLEAIAEAEGITRERVRQLKQKALTRIRKSKQAAALASFRGQ